MNPLPFSLPIPPLGLLRQLPLPLPRPAVPEWLQTELQNRLVLALNHLLQQEPQAMERLRRQTGKCIAVSWQTWEWRVQATPVGLLAQAPASATPELRLRLQATSPWALAQTTLSGAKPALDIQGDVQLAAEVAWLADHLRWEWEEDLSRLLGDAMAHRVGQALRSVAQALRPWLQQVQARFDKADA